MPEPEKPVTPEEWPGRTAGQAALDAAVAKMHPFFQALVPWMDYVKEMVLSTALAGGAPDPTSNGGDLLGVQRDGGGYAFISADKGARNKFINGQMISWPEGTSRTGTGNIPLTYDADGWLVFASGSQTGAPWTVERVAIDDTVTASPIPGQPPYKLQCTTDHTLVSLRHRIEGVRTLAGRQVTVSVWVESEVDGSLNMRLDQKFGTGGAASAAVSNLSGGAQSVTAGGLVRYDWVMSLDDIVGKTIDGGDDHIEAVFTFNPATAPTASYTAAFTEMSMVAGNATNEPIPGTWGTEEQEIARCRRYYWAPPDINIYSGDVTSGNLYYLPLLYPVQMRTVPTVTATVTAATRFPLTAPTVVSLQTGGLYLSHVANGTGSGAYRAKVELDARL